jgi:tetratricopeptide (TPR) repeat protein
MAVRAAMELAVSSRWPPGVQACAGVVSGQLFTGPVGAGQRREYTAMGDGINLAARLMQHAKPGQVLCEASCARLAVGLRFKELSALTVKGKKAPVEVAEPMGEAEDGAAVRRVLVERDEICGSLAAFLSGAGGRALLLGGEAGLGKSALLDWVAAAATESGVTTHRMNLGPYSQERPYAVWRGPMRAVTGVNRGDAPAELLAARDAAFAREPAGYRVLLNPLLDLPEETNASIRNLSPKERKDLTFAMLGRAFKAGGPRLLLCDNLHHADPLSLELLAFLLEDAEEAPWRLVGTLRPSLAPAGIPEFLELRVVGPLSPKGVEALLQEGHDLSHVPKEVLAWFSERSGGNPALVCALVTAVEAAGLLVRDEHGGRVDQDRLFKTAFPDTLEGLYLARLDRLSAREREVLQYASILGASVSVNLLHQLSGQKLDALHRVLHALEGAGLLMADSWGTRPYRRFADALLRDAVYHALPFAFKRKAHLALARLLDVDAGGNSKLWPTLAHHYEQGGEEERARRYHRLAGRDALARYDNINALRHLEFVCKVLTSDEQDVEDAFSLMDAYGFLGRWADARPLLASLSGMENEFLLRQQARLQNFVSQDWAAQQNLQGAEKALLKGIELAEKAKDYATQGKAYVNLVGRVYGPTGRLKEAKEALDMALALPKGPDQAVFRTMAMMNLGVVNRHLGNLAEAETNFIAAYDLSSRAFLGPQKGAICCNLGALSNDLYRSERAVHWSRKAESILESFALRGILLNAQEILSAAYLDMGRSTDAKAMLELISHQAQVQSDTRISALAHKGLAQAAQLEGDIREFLRLGLRALEGLGSQSHPTDFAFTIYMVLDFLRMLGQKERGGDIAERLGMVGFLKQADLPSNLRNSLTRLAKWAQGRAKSSLSSSEMAGTNQAYLPEDSLEAHLSRAVCHAESGNAKEAESVMSSAEQLCEEKPLFESQLRLLQVRVRLAGMADVQDERQARRLLARCHGGIHGTRLACQMALVTDARATRRWLKDARERLAVLEAHSPDWAWGAICKFPEVNQVLALEPIVPPRHSEET